MLSLLIVSLPLATVYAVPSMLTVRTSPASFIQVPVTVAVWVLAMVGVTAGVSRAVTLVLLPKALVAVALIFAHGVRPLAGRLPLVGVAVPMSRLQVPPLWTVAA